MASDDDHHWMGVALALAARALGQAWPNPAVGCVLARDGRVVGRGWTGKGGRPHAETEALKRAGPAALGATAYISLEPCAHYGATPPCTMALLQAGVRRAVVAAPDPDPRVDGRGLAQLRQAGVAVATGIRQEEAEALNAGFIERVRRGRPLVTLKLAASKDARIATRTGASRWITGEAARARAHLLRAGHDAIMIGSGTALADDPELTCRVPGLEDRSPVRVVLDARLRVPVGARLVRTARAVPLIVLTGMDAPAARASELQEAGVEVARVPAGGAGGLDLAAVLGDLGRRGLTRVLVEGGAALAAALVRARLVDRLVWFEAPLLIGGDGRPALDALAVGGLDEACRLAPDADLLLAPDRMQSYIVRGS